MHNNKADCHTDVIEAHRYLSAKLRKHRISLIGVRKLIDKKVFGDMHASIIEPLWDTEEQFMTLRWELEERFLRALPKEFLRKNRHTILRIYYDGGAHDPEDQHSAHQQPASGPDPQEQEDAAALSASDLLFIRYRLFRLWEFCTNQLRVLISLSWPNNANLMQSCNKLIKDTARALVLLKSFDEEEAAGQ
jgi:hypothetical protein